jgi:hypothetical protein
MEITRRLSRDGNFCPPAVNILGQIPDSALFHVAHQLRHPDSIYSFSLQKIAGELANVMDGYFSKMDEYRGGVQEGFDVTDLLRSQESLLRALQEHLDDCYLILKTLVDPATARHTPLFADKYVVENRLPGAKSFRSAIQDYKRSLTIANKLRHQQGRLRGVAMSLPTGAHLGYFLEGPDAAGLIGPSPEIHPDRGCFSFSRDVNWHLFNVYYCSEKLVEAIDAALVVLHGVNVQPRPAEPIQEWDRVVSLACRIPQALFPKELQRHTGIFRYDSNGQTLTVKFPEHVRFTFPPHAKVTCSSVIDGHSPSFNVPFP